MSVPTILLLIAVIVFVVDSFKVPAPIKLSSVGLAFLTAAFLVGAL